jgi:NAD(P)-dependent dehydrogenase (short-subunit alcohol dehydrogenase family)
LPLFLDLTDHSSITSAAETVAEATEEAGLWGLINNAGVAVAGPLEFLPIDG